MDVSPESGADRRRQLLARIADGALHSGAELARELGVSRTSIWHYAQALVAMGVPLEAARGNGYRLTHPLELLVERAIAARLSPGAGTRIERIDIHFEIDSTNQRLLDLAAERDVHAHACFAEVQTAGRGRRGRRWVAPACSGICVSLGWRFDAALESLAGLSLAVGVAVHRAVSALGVAGGLELKWPNDVLLDRRKLAGILVEVRGETTGPCLAVVGIGLNVALPASVRERIEPPAVDLQWALGGIPSRNVVAAELLNTLTASVVEFEQHGLAAFADDWMRHDALAGREVDIAVGERTMSGRAEGVDADGALRVRVGGELRRFHSGEVSARATR